MKYFMLIWAGLWRKKTRTILTMLSIAVAFLLFGLLQGDQSRNQGGARRQQQQSPVDYRTHECGQFHAHRPHG